jgi:hypothetical protein
MFVDAAGRTDQGSMSSSPNVALDDLLAVTWFQPLVRAGT